MAFMFNLDLYTIKPIVRWLQFKANCETFKNELQ